MNQIERKITVCSECKMASCWYWQFPCEKAFTAGLIEMPVKELAKLNRENPSYWTEGAVEKYTGTRR